MNQVIIFSGAGLSAESGISTFRDANGLWENYNIMEVCHISTWKQNFDLVHRFYNERRRQLKDVEPNAAHIAIAEFKKKYPETIIITQNIDDLLERAGLSSDDVIHVHGELTKMKCEACGTIWEVGYSDADKCPKCSSVKGVKPFVVFFGESAPNYRRMFKIFDLLDKEDTTLIVIGTMGNVISIRDIIGSFYQKNYKKVVKGKTILCNLDKSEYLPEDLFDIVRYDTATNSVPQILKELEDIKNV